MKKRILSILIIFAMVLSATSTVAFAKTGEIYSFDFNSVPKGQITDNSHLDDYFSNIPNTDYVKAYVTDNEVLHEQNSSLFTNYDNGNGILAAAGSFEVSEDGVLSIEKNIYKFTQSDGKTAEASYEVRYADGTFDNYLPSTGSYTVSMKMKTAFEGKTGMQIAFGGHFQFTCNDTSVQTLSVKYHDGSAWKDVCGSDGEKKLYNFGDYQEIKFVVDNSLTDLYIGDELVAENVPVRKNQSSFETIRITGNASAEFTANIKEIRAYRNFDSNVYKLAKSQATSSTQSSHTSQMLYGSLIEKNDAQNYTLSFDMYPELSAGSINLAFGVFFEFKRTANGVYTITGREGSASAATLIEGLEIKSFVPVKIVIVDGKGSLYVNNELIKENAEYRNNYKTDKLQITFNNGTKGNVYVDNIKLSVEKDLSTYLTGEYKYSSSSGGNALYINAYPTYSCVGDSVRTYVAYFSDADQENFIGATVKDIEKGQVSSWHIYSSIPKGAVSANVMMWNEDLVPLCDYVTVSLTNE